LSPQVDSLQSPLFPQDLRSKSREDNDHGSEKRIRIRRWANVEQVQIQRRRNGIGILPAVRTTATGSKRDTPAPVGAKGACLSALLRALLCAVQRSRVKNLQSRCMLRPSANRLDRVWHRCGLVGNPQRSGRHSLNRKSLETMQIQWFGCRVR
jgi:hypothetical protein